MIEIKNVTDDTIEALLRDMRARSDGVSAEISATAAEIMEDVRTRGFDAVCAYSMKLDGCVPYEITREQLDEAARTCPPELYAAMERAAGQIEAYQSRLLPQSASWDTGKNSAIGQTVRGLDRVGIYVPGGRAAYPSSVLMNAIPAKVAGVREIVMVTPPTAHLNNAVMAAAKLSGVDRVIAVGGAQAVAAVTYGAGFIPRVDKLVGPGNAYVAAAKRMAFGRIDIDMVAGPSEILVIADETANPAFVAADMLSQAEHDVMASAILVTTSKLLAERAAEQLQRQMERLDRREIIKSSLRDYGAIFVCDTLQSACRLANEIAPEHLEIMTENPNKLLPEIRNAGAVFLGQSSPEPLGDYMAGPSHVLPTSGTARFFSPLSADSFLKKMSVIQYSREDLESVYREIDTIARAEQLTAHAQSVNIRFI